MMGSLASAVRRNASVRGRRFVLRTMVLVQDYVLLAGMAPTVRQVADARLSHVLTLLSFTTRCKIKWARVMWGNPQD